MNIRKPHLKSIKINNVLLQLTNEQLHKQNDIHTAYILDFSSNQTKSHHVPTSSEELYARYYNLIVKAGPNIKYIYTKLLGVANSQFSPRFSFYALFSSLANCPQKYIGQIIEIKLFLNNKKMYDMLGRELYFLHNLHKKFNYSIEEIFEISKYYTITPPDFKQKKTLTLNNFAFSNNPASKITDHLYISRIPLEEDAEVFMNKHPKLAAVVSVLEDFEIVDNSFLLNIQSPEKWESNRIKHYQIPIRENSQSEINFPLTRLANILSDIDSMIKVGKDVLIYCSNGTRRSGLVVMAYLKIYGSNHISPNADNDAIYRFIKKERPQVILNETDFAVIDALVNHIQSEKCLNNSKDITGESHTKLAINTIDEFLKAFSGKETIIQMTSIKILKALALDNQSKYLTLVNDFLADLCMVGGLSELKKLTLLKDNLEQHKIKVFNEIMKFVGTLLQPTLHIHPDALVPLSLLRQNVPKLNAALEPHKDESHKNKSLHENYAKTLLIFTDPVNGLMLLVENKLLGRGSMRIFNDNNNVVTTPCELVAPEVNISFTALNQLVNKLGINYQTILPSCPKAFFYYVSAINKTNVTIYTYCLDLGIVTADQINPILGMNQLRMLNPKNKTEYHFINIKSLDENAYCMDKTQTSKKLDEDDLLSLRKLIANEQRVRWQPHIETVQKGLSFFSPDCEDLLDKMISTSKYDSVRLQDYLSFVDEQNSNATFKQFSLQEILNVLSPHGELMKSEETPVFGIK